MELRLLLFLKMRISQNAQHLRFLHNPVLVEDWLFYFFQVLKSGTEQLTNNIPKSTKKKFAFISWGFFKSLHITSSKTSDYGLPIMTLRILSDEMKLTKKQANK